MYISRFSQWFIFVPLQMPDLGNFTIILRHSRAAVIVEKCWTVFDCNWRRWNLSSKMSVLRWTWFELHEFQISVSDFYVPVQESCLDKYAYHTLIFSKYSQRYWYKPSKRLPIKTKLYFDLFIYIKSLFRYTF